MIQSTITLSLLPTNPKAPFVLGPDLETAVASAANHGFPAFELFPPELNAIDVEQLQVLTARYNIKLSTIGTGGGWVRSGLSLTDASADVRQKAKEYIQGVIQRAADLGAMAIIGSMQGRCGDRDRDTTMAMLTEGLGELSEIAQACGQPLLYEPLNRKTFPSALPRLQLTSPVVRVRAPNDNELARELHCLRRQGQ